MTHSPSRSIRASSVSSGAAVEAAARGARARGTTSGAAGSRSSSIAERIAAISSRRRPAAAADQPRAEPPRVRGELGEVLGRRVRVDDAAAGEAREADVRERGERRAVVAPIASSAASAACRPGAVVRARSAARSSGRSRSAASAAETPAERLGALVEGQHRDDRAARRRCGRPRSRSTSSSRSKNVSSMNRSTPRPSRICACSAKTSARCSAGATCELAERPDRAGDEDVRGPRPPAPRARA